uniref:Zgc:77056 n=1 Tax=Amphiprion percula TaxID=161767 RepID=A0A3P8SBC1_AMPPE
MNKNKASGVAWVKPAEPSFLKKFKSDAGYKEGPNVDTKRQEMPTLDDDSGSDKEDELPQVVVLKSGDLTAEEVKKIKDEMHAGGGAEKDAEAPPDGKIIFKKPAKRSSSDKFQGITASSSKKKKSDRGEKEEEEKKEGKSGKKIKNNSLLSFGGDEEEEDD